MKRWVCVLALIGAASAAPPASSPAPSPWPEVTHTARPWTRWWWPGSAVDRAGITRQLEQFAAAGIGGVEITPIYGARGAEARYLDFLSPRWMEMLAYTASEAQRLGLGVDVATGTGWPFGGPAVSPADGAMQMTLLDGQLAGAPTRMTVKRAGPGGAGLVLDPYSTAALGRYLAPFSKAYDGLPRGALRAQFHDSFEYYDAGWTRSLPAKFRELNGYDIQTYAQELVGRKPLDADTLSRVKGDYRRTLARLHLDYVTAWVTWSHAQGFIARNQSHGAPANLLDLYAAVDIPETESYGMTKFPIPGLRAAPDDVNEDPDPAINLIGRFASSAAHVMGRPLASSETLTWLRENFREPPAAAKPQLDRLFAAGINHIVYHGTAYSPADAPWPGWFFYAATQLKPENPLWEDFGGMHAYVARVQSVLQSGRPDNDVLLYWPFDDLMDDAAGGMRQLAVHDNRWLVESDFGKLAADLIRAGYGVDFVSDAQLLDYRTQEGNIHNGRGGSIYSAVVVPRVRRMPVESLARLRDLRAAGADVVFASMPEDVPGLGHLEARRREFSKLASDDRLRSAIASTDVLSALRTLGIRREAAPGLGLSFARRARRDGVDYFLVNAGAQAFDGWLPLVHAGKHPVLLDPLDGSSGAAAVQGDAVYLQLEPGRSLIVRGYSGAAPRARPWPYAIAAGAAVPLDGPWQVTFLAGGPELSPPATLAQVASWTTLADPRAQSFSGTARYRVTFDAPVARADDWLLDLGDVREAARVRLNGKDIGIAWSLPFRLRIGALRPKGNVLEIDVTNLPANRIRDLDRRKVDWKIMGDINLASLRYQALDASRWDVAPSGLNSAVTLVPLRRSTPR
jgi:alpha-L-rhamnosidase